MEIVIVKIVYYKFEIKIKFISMVFLFINLIFVNFQ
jgi:hypothetical protein